LLLVFLRRFFSFALSFFFLLSFFFALDLRDLRDLGDEGGVHKFSRSERDLELEWELELSDLELSELELSELEPLELLELELESDDDASSLPLGEATGEAAKLGLP
jgi:hypothetical protein